jgi:NAD(P)-dependent dehydrogenase (short-subunit alcohol dehydrogenase family)
VSPTVTGAFRDGLFGGRSVLVTGGTSGIGAGIGDAFAALGAHVTVTGATAREADEARSRTGSRLRDARALDVRDDAAIRKLVAELPRLDVLVNAAGVIRRDAEHDPEVFADTVAINLTGTMRCCTHARPKLAAAKGSIVNIASILSYFGGARVPGYAASKGGVAQLTRSLAIAYADEGIRVNAIAPGWVRTALTLALQEDAQRSEAIVARTPMRRWAEPADIAGAAVFLASPAAAFVTGVLLPVDGGYHVN